MANKRDMANMIRELHKEMYGESMTLEAATRSLDLCTEAIKVYVERGEDVMLTGFMSIKVVDVPAMTKRNPMTGVPVKVPAKKRVRVTPGSALKAAANKK